jgi:hypothetical protein
MGYEPGELHPHSLGDTNYGRILVGYRRVVDLLKRDLAGLLWKRCESAGCANQVACGFPCDRLRAKRGLRYEDDQREGDEKR